MFDCIVLVFEAEGLELVSSLWCEGRTGPLALRFEEKRECVAADVKGILDRILHTFQEINYSVI